MLWACVLEYALSVCFGCMLWEYALSVCFGRMLWVCVLGVCFGGMFWTYVLGECFGHMLLVYGFRAHAFGCITLGTGFGASVFEHMDFADESRSKVLNRQSQSVLRLMVM